MSPDNNVFIKHWVDGRLVQEIEEHNTWVHRGRVMLAEIVGYLPPVPTLTPERDERIKYLGIGIGGTKRAPQADAAPLSTSYPPGKAKKAYPPDYAPSGFTDGRMYDNKSPLMPRVETLEAPVRVSGGSTPYPGSPADVWRIGPPNLYCTHISTQELTVHATVDGTLGQVVYPPFTSVPVTEAGLYTQAVGVTNAYAPLVAYVTFSPVYLSPGSVVDFTWRIRFG